MVFLSQRESGREGEGEEEHTQQQWKVLENERETLGNTVENTLS